MHRIDVTDAPTGVTVQSDFGVCSPPVVRDRERSTMRLQTIRELLGAASPEASLERSSARPTCRWEQDTDGKLARSWTLQPQEGASVYQARITREMPRPR
jgi:hypothetical protein